MLVLVLGGNSDIGLALAEEFAAKERADLVLASRDVTALAPKARALAQVHGVKAQAVYFDARDTDTHASFYQALPVKPDVAVVAFGLLPDQQAAQNDFALARETFAVNLVGAASILEVVAADFAARRTGCIIGLSSVAGERGRKSNYVYGAAKAGLSVYLSGLRHRLHASGARVLTVLPGQARTKMTEHLRLSGPLVSEPHQIGRHVWRAWKRGADVAYAPPVWKLVMWLVRNLPEALFKRTGL